RRRAERGPRGLLRGASANPRAGRLAPAGLVQLRVDRAGRLLGDAGHALELFLCRREEAFGRPEVPDQRSPSRRTDPRQVVEDRLASLGAPARAMVAEGEAVRLVAQP